MEKKNKSIFYLVILLTGIFIVPLSAQFVIKGTLIDGETMTPLPYATIHSGSKQSTTDFEGKFSLELPADADSIFLSYIGFNPISLKIDKEAGSYNLGYIYMISSNEQLNTVTITSGKFKKRIQDVTVSMEILKPGFIERNHSANFSDILDKIPGVNYVDGQVNIRGGSGYSYGAGSRVLLLVDNIPALTSDAAFANWSDIPVESIAQVEVLKGAGSALYGSAAMNGVINILTKYATSEAEFDITTQLTSYLSPSDTIKKWWDTPPFKYNISSSFSKKFGALSVVAGGFLVQESSFRKDSYNNYGRLNAKLDYAVNENFILGLSANFNLGKSQTFFYWKNETYGAYLADSINYSTNTKLRYTLDPRISYFGKNDVTHRFNGRVYSVENNSDNNQSNFLTSLYGEYQIQKKWEEQHLVASSGWVSQFSNIEAPLYGDTSFQSINHAFYIQLEKQFFKKLIVNGGARYEINKINGPTLVNGMPVVQDSFESRPVFRLGVNYKMFPFTNIRASWGQGYRYPSIAEKYISTTAGILSIIPNPELRSETGWTAELGLRQGFSIGMMTGFVDLSAFQSRYTNMMEFNIKLGTFPPQFAAQNIGNTDIKGFEFSSGFNMKFKEMNWDLQAGYVYLDPKYREFNDTIKLLSSTDTNILKYRNKHSFKFNTNFTYKGFSFGIGSEYRSFMEAIDAVFNEFIPGVKNFRSIHNQGTQIWYGSFGYKYKNWLVSLRADNLFNEEYTVRPAELEAPRSLSLRLKYEL